jgi:hypothetical protein
MLVCDGLLVPVTVPEPVPGVATVTPTAAAKVALTVTGLVPIVKVQSPVPGQFTPVLDQPTKVDPAGAACKVTVFPVVMVLLLAQVPDVVPAVDVQLMPNPVVSVTVPLPLPAPPMVTVVALNAAVTDWAEFMVTEQAPEPLHAPPHPANAVPAGAVGVSATDVPCVKGALQVPAPELQPMMPEGKLLTVAEAGPVALTVSVNCGATMN